PNRGELFLADLSRTRSRCDPCAPENFIRHPVADTGKPFLQKKQGLNGGARVSSDELPHRGLREFGGVNFRRAHVPPCRRLPAMVEADDSESPLIAENERAV